MVNRENTKQLFDFKSFFIGLILGIVLTLCFASKFTDRYESYVAGPYNSYVVVVDSWNGNVFRCVDVRGHDNGQ